MQSRRVNALTQLYIDEIREVFGVALIPTFEMSGKIKRMMSRLGTTRNRMGSFITWWVNCCATHVPSDPFEMMINFGDWLSWERQTRRVPDASRVARLIVEADRECSTQQ